MKYKFYTRTETGNFRKSNQDSIYAKNIRTNFGNAFMGIVCDGMGGLSNGEVASHNVVVAFAEWFEEEFQYIMTETVSEQVVFIQWQQIIADVNFQIRKLSVELGCKMGTTLSVLMLFNGKYYAAQIGDSRIYCSDETQVFRITRDHSLVSDMERAGLLTESEMKTSCKKNVLTRCVGLVDEVSADFYHGECTNQAFLLCSDGFYGVLQNLDTDLLIRDILINSNIKKYTDIAVEKRMEYGERDNISVVAIKAFIK